MAQLQGTLVGGGENPCSIIFPVKPLDAVTSNNVRRSIITDFRGYTTPSSTQSSCSSLFLGTSWYHVSSSAEVTTDNCWYTGIGSSTGLCITSYIQKRY